VTSDRPLVTEETATGWRALLELSPQASQALKRAQDEARAMRHSAVEPEHQFLALFGDQGGITAGVLADAGLTVAPAREIVRKRLGTGSGQPAEGRIPLSRAAMEAMDAASRVAFGVGSYEIGTEHLLLAMVTLLRNGGAFKIIDELNVDPRVIRIRDQEALAAASRSGRRPPGSAVERTRHGAGSLETDARLAVTAHVPTPTPNSARIVTSWVS
jgi:ATP-dependent Clp protease ATP-binding subunit ClpA